MKRKTPIRAFSILETSSVGRRNRRAAETRLRLFRCALQLVAERGLPRVTVEDITEAADVGKGTFFNYFESKNHLLATIVDVSLEGPRGARVSHDGKALNPIRAPPPFRTNRRRTPPQS
jgi:AcrR family transcriptional regulator